MQKELIARWSDDNIVALIQKLRDDYIKIFLDERYVKEYVQAKFSVNEISNVKIQFIKKDIKDILNSSIDPEHYGSMILEVKNNDLASLHHENEGLFLRQIDKILIKHIF